MESGTCMHWMMLLRVHVLELVRLVHKCWRPDDRSVVHARELLRRLARESDGGDGMPTHVWRHERRDLTGDLLAWEWRSIRHVLVREEGPALILVESRVIVVA